MFTRELLRLVKHKAVPMEAASAVSGTCHEHHPSAVYQYDLLTSQRPFNLFDIAAQCLTLKQSFELHKGLCGCLLQMGCINNPLRIHNHSCGYSAGCIECLAVLARNTQTTAGRRPRFFVRPPHPIIKDILLPRVHKEFASL